MRYVEYQVGYMYRLPLNDDGSPAGTPQLTNHWCRPIKSTGKAPSKKKPKKIVKDTTREELKDEYM